MLYEFEVIYNRKTEVLYVFPILFVETFVCLVLSCVYVYDESPSSAWAEIRLLVALHSDRYVWGVWNPPVLKK